MATQATVTYELNGGGQATSSATALLFPGQGSQDRRMRADVSAHAGELLAIAVGELGVDPFDHLDEGTVYLQPAVYAGTLARWRSIGAPVAECAVGHSLGELAALVAAGCLDAEAGMRLVLARGRLMQAASETQPPGGLLALIGERESAMRVARDAGVSVALDNEPTQLVVAGADDELERTRTLAASQGLRSVRLRVPAALHSTAMLSAMRPFREALERVSFARPQMTVIANVTARPFANVPEELALALVSGVRFREAVLRLHALGVRRYVELGSRATLTGLVERTLAALD